MKHKNFIEAQVEFLFIEEFTCWSFYFLSQKLIEITSHVMLKPTLLRVISIKTFPRRVEMKIFHFQRKSFFKAFTVCRKTFGCDFAEEKVCFWNIYLPKIKLSRNFSLKVWRFLKILLLSSSENSSAFFFKAKMSAQNFLVKKFLKLKKTFVEIWTIQSFNSPSHLRP